MPADDSLGNVVEWAPARVPERAPIAGQSVWLDPLDPAAHAVPLFASSHGPETDPDLWLYMGVGPFATLEEFARWLEICAASSDPLFFTVVDEHTGHPSGMASYLRITPPHGVIEIGNIWFSAALQRTRQATEAIFLLARHAFDDLGYRRLEWKCNALNARSRRAADRFGFCYEGLFRQHMVIKGRSRDTAWFSMTDRDWPAIRSAFERWLAPENFDAGGQQRQSLAAVRAVAQAGEPG